LRLRALLQALSVEIFGMPLALADFPPMKLIRGLGMTDQMECASLLEFEDRTRWAMELDAEVKRRAVETARLYDELNQERFRSASWEASRRTHLGRALGLGPKL
jgi:hypothetical protein